MSSKCLYDSLFIRKALVRDRSIIPTLFSYSSLLFHQIKRGYSGDDCLLIIHSFLYILGCGLVVHDFDFGRFYKEYPGIYDFIRTSIYFEDKCDSYTCLFNLIVNCSTHMEVSND